MTHFVNKTLLLFLLSFYSVFSQIETKNYTKISGTKCSILAPNGFIVSSNFDGLQNVEKGASIMITELPGSYFMMHENFNAENLKSRGMILISKETVDYNNSQATYIKVRQEANGIQYLKQIVMFGNQDYTVLANGIYPEKYKQIEKEIKTALFSIKYDKNEDISTIENVDFDIDLSTTNFIFTKQMSNTIIYTIDGKFPTEHPFFMAGKSISKINAKNKKEYSVERLKNLPNGKSITIESITSINIDGLDGYEIIGYGKNSKEEDEQIYQIMLYTESSDYYIMIGITSLENKDYLKTFKEIAQSFRIKK